jgi:hypothetical protein
MAVPDMKKWILGMAILAFIVMIPLVCIMVERISAPSYGSGSVVLIEHLSQSRGRLVNGTYPEQTLSGKSYDYDAEKKLLDVGGLVVNDTLRAVIGISNSLSQDAGNGADGEAYGLYDIPSGAGELAVDRVASDGTVTLTYNNLKIVLAPGQRWERISTDAVTTPNYSIKLTVSDSIRNSGFVSKAAIR